MVRRIVLAALLLTTASTALAEGPENWPEGTGVPEWWPAAVALYPGSTVEAVDHAEEKGLPDIDSLVPVAGATVEEIEAWYRKMLEEAGWEVWKTRETPNGLRFTSQNKEIDKRIIVETIRPKQFLRNKSEHPLVKFTVDSRLGRIRPASRLRCAEDRYGAGGVRFLTWNTCSLG